MQKLIINISIFSIIIALVAIVIARDHRPSQIPNGSVFGCANCHFNPAGGGARNAFGEEVETNFLDVVGPGGNVQWGPALAAIDSDGDGISNGAELGDPNGTWSIGQPAPGDPASVTNPGDSASVTAILANQIIPEKFSLDQNYPNPFNPSTSIEFSVHKTEKVTITVYNMLGKEVKILVDEVLPAGSYITTWNGTDALDFTVSTGTYVYSMQSNDKQMVKKMLLLK